MKKEEYIIKQKLGNQNPFRVPDGYFDELTSKVMSQIPEHETHVVNMRPRWYRYRTGIVAAACVVAAFFSVGTYLHLQQNEPSQVASTQQYYYDADATMDAMANYAMLDNEEIYASLQDTYE